MFLESSLQSYKSFTDIPIERVSLPLLLSLNLEDGRDVKLKNLFSLIKDEIRLLKQQFENGMTKLSLELSELSLKTSNLEKQG
jgi:hypothetical protein